MAETEKRQNISINKTKSIRMGVGIALGIAVGAALHNIAIGLIIGIIIGGIGVAIDHVSKRKN